MKTLKNWPQKLLIIGPDPFISQSSPDHSPESIFQIMKSQDQTSVLLSVKYTYKIPMYVSDYFCTKVNYKLYIF